jgi:hypothetical protein
MYGGENRGSQPQERAGFVTATYEELVELLDERGIGY